MTDSANGKKVTLAAPKGMHDQLPEAEPAWDRIRKAAREVTDFYNFVRIDTPLLEHAELFERGIGAGTDIVEKQMFVFTTKSKERLVLRPEFTAGIARAFIEHGLAQLGSPLKLWTSGALFRYEQPQAGRYRQFHQIDLEIISTDDDPIYDTQTIIASWRLLEALKIKNATISINSIGCKNCRPNYRRQLQGYFRSRRDQLCEDCTRRLETNPLRLLDCKQEGCSEARKGAPIIIDHLCVMCRTHFKTVLEYLDELKLPYALDHYLVRGLDYYSKTVFEVFAEGYPLALCGGGRYDYLIELLGGKAAPAVGFAAGIERIVEAMRVQGVAAVLKEKPKVFLIHIGDLAKRRSLALIEELRHANIGVAESLGRESLRGQLKNADKMGSPLALIFGQREAYEQSIIIRDLATGVQETVLLTKLVETIKKHLRHEV